MAMPGEKKRRGQKVDGQGEPCRHCRRRKITRPRRMCWNCYYNPDVTRLYPQKDTKHNNRGIHGGNNDTAPAPLPEPITKRPDPLNYFIVLMNRALAREELFHPDDLIPPLGPAPADPSAPDEDDDDDE